MVFPVLAVVKAVSKSIKRPAVKTSKVKYHNGTAYETRGGWTTVYDPKRGVYKARNSMVKKAFDKEEHRYYTHEDALYSDVINNTSWGAKITARKHVQGMLTKAIHDNDTEMIATCTEILSKSDEVVAKFWADFLKEKGNAGVEDYFDYDQEQSFEDYMNEGSE